MDSYSFISENGQVRQIIDLVAQAKDEEQDHRLDQIEQVDLIDRYSETEVQTKKRWIDGSPIYRIVRSVNPVSVGGSTQYFNYAMISPAPRLIINANLVSVLSTGPECSIVDKIRMNGTDVQVAIIVPISAANVRYLIMEYVK